jgi:hypothetical protein
LSWWTEIDLKKVVDLVDNKIFYLFLGTALSVLGQAIYSWLKRPKLKISEDIPITGDNLGIRAKIINDGYTAAINCTGSISIEKVEQVDTDGNKDAYIKPNVFRPLKDLGLCWAHIGNPYTFTINAKTAANLDICIFNKQENLLIFPTEKGFDPPRVRLKANKKYRGEIVVSAENCRPRNRQFEIDCSRDVFLEWFS